MKEELIALGKVLQSDFENTIIQQITGLLTNDFLTDADWQGLEKLEAELSSFFEINNQFAALEAWLTSGFMPGESPDFDLATAEWIAAKGESFPISSPNVLNPKNVVWNQPGNSDLPSSGQLIESSLIEDIENITQREGNRSPLQPENSTPTTGNNVKNITQREGKRSPLQPENSTPMTGDNVKNITQREDKRSPSQPENLAAILENSTSTLDDYKVKNVTQQEGKRSPLGLKQLANFLASEPYLDDSETVINQQTKVIQQEIQTAYFSSQDGGDLQKETKIDWTDLISKTIPQNDYPILENHNIDIYPTSNHKAQISKNLTSNPELFNQETQIEIEPNSARSLNNNSEIDMDLIMEAIAQEINREYRRFYGS
jgi:hypothetical protein